MRGKRRARLGAAALLLALLLGLCVPAWADESKSVTLALGESLTVVHYANASDDYSYHWELTAGEDLARITSAQDEVSCTVASLGEGTAVLRGTASRVGAFGRTYYYTHTVTIKIYQPVRRRFRVTFDPCGGSVEPESIMVTNGLRYPALPEAHRPGFHLEGWYTRAEGGAQITSQSQVQLTRDQTLYAHWLGDTWRLSFDANGGRVADSVLNVVNGGTYGALPLPSRSGHSFLGWYTEARGGELITAESTVMLSQDATLYAHWRSGGVEEDRQSAPEITVLLDGRPLAFDVPPVLQNDRTLVPLRAIFEALGAEVAWDAAARTVTSQRGTLCVILQIDNASMRIITPERTRSVTLDAPPVIVQDRTLVPLRAVTEAFGCTVDWDAESRTVRIARAG